MSLDNVYWGGRGNCPECGRFVGHIRGTINPLMGLVRVTGVCKYHGVVDLTHQGWSFDEFDPEDDAFREYEVAR